MDFSWTDEQLALREEVIKFAQKNLNQDFFEREKAGKFSRELWQKCAEFGIQGLSIPEEYGGNNNSDILAIMLIMEALGYSCHDKGLLFSINAQMWSVQSPILSFGTEKQKKELLPGLCNGTLIGAHGMSEPNYGSESFGLTTRAEKKDDHYILNGNKTFVTNAPEADLIVTFATVDKQKGMWGITCFVVDRNTPGCTIGKPMNKMGLTTSPMAEIAFEDCVVPCENILGYEGQGATIFNHSMGMERSCILATTIGAMERQFENCLQYAKEREQFGKPIGNFQLISSKLVDMKMRLETSRLLLYKAAWALHNKQNIALEAAMAKLYISESAVQSALDAIQIHGGYGYMKELEIERDLRDMVGGKIYSGTSEIQRLIIARNLGLSPSN